MKIRLMTMKDYSVVYRLWMSCKGKFQDVLAKIK